MMPNYCIYQDCLSLLSGDITFFCLPKVGDPRRNLWIENSGNKYLKAMRMNENYVGFFCEKHFDSNLISKRLHQTILHKHALPHPYDRNIPKNSKDLEIYELHTLPDEHRQELSDKEFYTIIEMKTIQTNPQKVNKVNIINTRKRRASFNNDESNSTKNKSNRFGGYELRKRRNKEKNPIENNIQHKVEINKIGSLKAQRRPTKLIANIDTVLNKDRNQKEDQRGEYINQNQIKYLENLHGITINPRNMVVSGTKVNKFLKAAKVKNINSSSHNIELKRNLGKQFITNNTINDHHCDNFLENSQKKYNFSCIKKNTEIKQKKYDRVINNSEHKNIEGEKIGKHNFIVDHRSKLKYLENLRKIKIELKKQFISTNNVSKKQSINASDNDNEQFIHNMSNDVDNRLFDNEEKIIEVLSSNTVVEQHQKDNEADKHFLLSLMENFERLTYHKKSIAKIKILQFLIELEHNDNVKI